MIPSHVRVRCCLRRFARVIRIMQFTAFLIIAICFKVNGRINAQEINLALRNVPLSKVFKEIQKQTGYQFLYPDELLKSKKQVSIVLRSASLQQALDKCLAPEMLDYVIDDRTIIIMPT
jgi:hypothetical protein